MDYNWGKLGPTFSSFNAMSAKITKTLTIVGPPVVVSQKHFAYG